MSGVTVRLLSDLVCAGGTVVSEAPVLTQAQMQFRLGGQHRLFLAAPVEYGAWLDDADVERVIHIRDGHGDVYEWRVAEIVRTVDAGRDGGVIQVVGRHPSSDLQKVIVRQIESGATPRYNLGFTGQTLAQAIDSYIVASATEQGRAYIGRGTVESTLVFDLGWEYLTALALAGELEEVTGTEFDYIRNGDSGYLVSFVEQVGGSAHVVRFEIGRNLVTIGQSRRVEGFGTVIVPQGMAASDTGERATIGQAAWPVTLVDGADIYVGSHNGGPGPVAVDGQFVGMYVLKRNGTLTEITATEAGTPSKITVASAANIAVGDDIEIRADASGTLNTELAHPDAVGEHGRLLCPPVEDDSCRGERNYIVNPFFADWTNKPLVYAGRLDGSHSAATSADIKDLPVSQSISEGDVLYIGTGSTRVRRITANATISGTGTVTVSVSSGFTAAADTYVYIVRTSGRFPAGFEPSGGFPTEPHVLMHRSRAVSGVLEAVVNGAHDLSGLDSIKRLAVDGLTSGDEIHPGDEVWPSSSRASAVVLSPVTADGGGAATVTLHSRSAYTNDQAVEIRRPALAAEGGDDVVVLPCRFASSEPSDNRIAQSVGVRYTPGLTTLWARAGVTVRRSGVNIAAPLVMERGGTTEPPRLRLLLTGHAVISDVWVPDTNMVPGDEFDHTLSQSATVRSDTTVTVDVRGPWTTVTSAEFDPICFVRWLMVHLGPDEDVPPIEGSYATQLHQRGNMALLRRARVTTPMRCRAVDLARIGYGWDADEEKIVLGATGRVVDDELGDRQVRIVGYVMDLLDPLNSEVELEAVE